MQPFGCFMVGWQLRKQPERYMQFALTCFEIE
jgi:hypothetical protein